MINQQSAARSTSSTKQHKHICQLRTNTTACTWPANDHSNGVRDHSNNKARHPHTFLQRAFSGKKAQNSAIRGRMHATTGFFRGYCLLTTTFAWRSLTTGGTCIIQPSRPRGCSHSQCCRVTFPGAVIVVTTISSSFSHACACHFYIHVCMYVYLPKFNNQMHCYYFYDPYRSTMGIFLR